MKGLNWLFLMAFLSSLCIADQARNIDYDVTLKMVGVVHCRNCTKNSDISIKVYRRNVGNPLRSLLSAVNVKSDQKIDFKENYYWGYRVDTSEENPIVNILIHLEGSNCQMELIKPLREIPLYDGEFVFDIGELEMCG